MTVVSGLNAALPHDSILSSVQPGSHWQRESPRKNSWAQLSERKLVDLHTDETHHGSSVNPAFTQAQASMTHILFLNSFLILESSNNAVCSTSDLTNLRETKFLLFLSTQLFSSQISLFCHYFSIFVTERTACRFQRIIFSHFNFQRSPKSQLMTTKVTREKCFLSICDACCLRCVWRSTSFRANNTSSECADRPSKEKLLSVIQYTKHRHKHSKYGMRARKPENDRISCPLLSLWKIECNKANTLFLDAEPNTCHLGCEQPERALPRHCSCFPQN